MEEVKTARSGIKYIEPADLKIGPRSYSQALLQRIPHNDPNKVDISLKIGRYNNLSGRPDTDNPRSELTLTNEELNALIQYISQNYKAVEMNAEQFIFVENQVDARIIDKFKALVGNQSETANFLIENSILTDNVYLAASAIKRHIALCDFESMLKEDLSEHDWQLWFETNKWILGSDFAEILDERKIDTDNIADYIMRAYDGFIDLVEIKKPNGGMNFWANQKDHDNYIPSTDLIKAITQCLNYIYEIERESNSTKFMERTNSKVIKPRCILIFGRSCDWDIEKKEAYRILNASFSQVSIMTYDHLLDRAKNILESQKEDEKIVVSEKIIDELPF